MLRRPAPDSLWSFIAIGWFAAVATFFLAGSGFHLSTDDAMRLVQVRDWRAGQAWFDLTQYRLAPPSGVLMHWSRLLDVPLAALMWIGELFVSQELAERFAATVWPLTLLLLLLVATAHLASELGGRLAGQLSALFVAFSGSLLQHFRPGAIDHHGVQLVLLICSLWLLVRPTVRGRSAALAGGLCAASLTIGLELAPAVAVIAAAIATRWIVAGAAVARATLSFGASFAIVSAILFAISVPPARYAAPACDAFSMFHVGVVLLGGAGLVVLCAMSLSTLAKRTLGAVLLGAALVTLVIMRAPACLFDPLNLDPRLTQFWLAHVEEARSIVSLLRDVPHEVIPLYGLPVATLVLAVIRLAKDGAGWPWAICSSVLAVLTAVAFLQVRGASGANALAAAMLPAALMGPVVTQGSQTLAARLSAPILLALFNPLTLLLLGKAAALLVAGPRMTLISGGSDTCSRASDYRVLNEVTQGRVLAFIDAGPMILMQSPHAVFAAPYHRNIDGNSAMLDVMLAPPEQAVARLVALGADYVVFCPGAAERYIYAEASPDNLASFLARGDVPPGLVRLDHHEHKIQIYRVRAGQG